MSDNILNPEILKTSFLKMSGDTKNHIEKVKDRLAYVTTQLEKIGEPPHEGEFLLIIDENDTPSCWFALNGTTNIGRGKENELPLRDEKISRIHCAIENSDNGCILSDLESSNGTIVNDQKISSRTLCEGDIIKLGKLAMIFVENQTI